MCLFYQSNFATASSIEHSAAHFTSATLQAKPAEDGGHLQWDLHKVAIQSTQDCLVSHHNHALPLPLYLNHNRLQPLYDIHVALTTWIPTHQCSVLSQCSVLTTLPGKMCDCMLDDQAQIARVGSWTSGLGLIQHPSQLVPHVSAVSNDTKGRHVCIHGAT